MLGFYHMTSDNKSGWHVYKHHQTNDVLFKDPTTGDWTVSLRNVESHLVSNVGLITTKILILIKLHFLLRASVKNVVLMIIYLKVFF